MAKNKTKKAPSSMVQKLMARSDSPQNQTLVSNRDTSILIDAITAQKLDVLVQQQGVREGAITSLESSVDLACKIGDTLVLFGWAIDYDDKIESVMLGSNNVNYVNSLHRFSRPEINSKFRVSDDHQLGFLLMVDAGLLDEPILLSARSLNKAASLPFTLTYELKGNIIFNQHFSELIYIAEKQGYTNVYELLKPYIKSIDYGVDGIAGNFVTGWIFDERKVEREFEVLLKSGDVILASTLSTSSSSKSEQKGRFSIPIDYQELKAASKKLTIFIPELNKTIGVLDLGAVNINPILSEVNSAQLLSPVEAGELRGYFDNVDLNTLTVHGWAICANKKNCKVQVYLNNILVAEDKTAYTRVDLVLANITERNAGFRIAIPLSKINQFENEITVKVEGKDLAGSPRKIVLGNQLKIEIGAVKFGNLQLKVIGWVGSSINGDLYIDGDFVEKVDFLKQSTSAAELTASVKLNEKFLNGREHVFYVQIKQDNITFKSDLIVKQYPEYQVHVDFASLTSIKGWGFRQDINRPLNLAVFQGDAIVDAKIIAVDRPDVLNLKERKNVNLGFEIQITAPHKSAVGASYIVKDSDTGISLTKVDVWNQYEALQQVSQNLVGDFENNHLINALADIAVKTNQSSLFKTKNAPLEQADSIENHLDVVVPVYGGLHETIECLESVIAAKNTISSRVIVIDDCSPDASIQGYLNKLEQRQIKNLLILRRAKNGGFSETVNIGMLIAGLNDVVLLNADTVVQDRWLDKIYRAVSQDKRIATATTLSNNAEICTIPYMCKTLPVKNAEFALKVDLAAEKVNKGQVVDLPVGVGFCMYIRRAAISEIGLFDAAKWGRGYGEEVDFCLKAASRGWRNVLITDTFVVHRGGVSFGDEKLKRVLESAKKITESYPFYDALIQRFLHTDPVQSSRRAVNFELINTTLPKKRVLHIIHGYGGGTERYLRDVIDLACDEGYRAVVLRFEDNKSGSLKFNLLGTDLVDFFFAGHIEKYHADELELLKQHISALNFEFIHVHSPFNVPMSFLSWVKQQNYVVTIHDYAWICPRVTLNSMEGKYCGEPAPDACDACVSTYKPHGGLAEFVTQTKTVAEYKKYFADFIQGATKVITGALDVKARLENHGFEANYRVIAHPVSSRKTVEPITILASQAAKTGDLRVALIGGISTCKGYFNLIECAEAALQRKLPIKFIVFGYTTDDKAFAKLPNVQILGNYKEEELPELIGTYEPEIAFFPNQWPETFSYTLSTCFELGLWPVTTDIGAPAERIRDADFGSLIPINSDKYEVLDILMAQRKSIKNQMVRGKSIMDLSPSTLTKYYGQ